jgi:hypothetical protein
LLFAGLEAQPHPVAEIVPNSQHVLRNLATPRSRDTSESFELVSGDSTEAVAENALGVSPASSFSWGDLVLVRIPASSSALGGSSPVSGFERNHYNVTVLLGGTMTARCRLVLGVLFLFVCGRALPQTVAQVNTDVPSKDIRVTLLGTASGPRAFVDKADISTLIEAGGERLLFDAGRGFMQRLVQAGFPMSAVTKLFLTHLHSDHVLGVPDLMLSPWSAAPERKVPLEVWVRMGRAT